MMYVDVAVAANQITHNHQFYLWRLSLWECTRERVMKTDPWYLLVKLYTSFLKHDFKHPYNSSRMNNDAMICPAMKRKVLIVYEKKRNAKCYFDLIDQVRTTHSIQNKLCFICRNTTL